MTVDYVEPQDGLRVLGGTVLWVCGECGRGNEQSSPMLKDGEEEYRCHYCGAPVKIEEED